MIYRISERIVDYLEVNNYLREDREIYLHGARLLISSIIGTCFVLVIGILFDCLIEAIIYEMIMTISREVMGGYHSKSYMSCIFLYVSIFIINVFVSVNINFSFFSIAIIEVIGLIITYLFCPVRNINKIVTDKKREKFKIYSIILIITYICILNYLYLKQFIFLNFITCIFITIQILTIGGTLDYEKTKK